MCGHVVATHTLTGMVQYRACTKSTERTRNKEQTKPNNSAETGAEAEVSASAIGSKRVVCKYSVPVKPKPN